MEQVALYLLKVNVGISILFAAYLLLLKPEKLFILNRLYLLVTILLPFILPFLPVISFGGSGQVNAGVSAYNPFASIYSAISSVDQHGFSTNAVPGIGGADIPRTFNFSWTILLAAVYAGISFFFIGRILIQIYSMMRFIGSIGQRHLEDTICYCKHEKALAPFSFGRFLVLNPKLYEREQLNQIIAHEKVHIRQRHTFDIILVEIIQAVMWINPLITVMKRYLKLNLEYIADQEVLRTGIDRQQYQYSILDSSVRLSHFPLASLFNSSKLKLRIKMMNTTTSRRTSPSKMFFLLPIVVAAYFAVNPAFAGSAKKIFLQTPAEGLQRFEGYYQLSRQKDMYIQALIKDNRLVLKQLWDNKEMFFDQQSDREFYDKAEKIPLKFTKDSNRSITQFLAFSRDVWVKVKSYTPVIPEEIQLSNDDLQHYAGTYKLKGPQEAFLQFSAKGNGLLVKEMWSGKEILIAPQSKTDFFGKTTRYPVKFTQDANGAIHEALIYEKDVWEKVKDNTTPHAIRLSKDQLKSFAGKYRFPFEPGKYAYIEIKTADSGLLVTALWNNNKFELYPETDLNFFSAEHRFTMKFTKDQQGRVIHVLAFNNDLWEKV